MGERLRQIGLWTKNKHVGGSWRRPFHRIAVVVGIAMVVSIGVPAKALPDAGSTGSPWSWLSDLLASRPVWAGGDVKVPQQQAGRGDNRGHYVAAPVVKDLGKEKKAKGELDRYQPHQPSSTVTTTPAAGGFQAQGSKRIAAAASSNSDVYHNPDGSFTRRTYPHPVNYRAANGSWLPINSTLRPGTGGRFEVAGNSFGMSFSPGQSALAQNDMPQGAPRGGLSARDESAGSVDELVRITTSGGQVFAYSLAGASIGRAHRGGEVVTYRDVFPEVDLELGAMATGAKEKLILRSAAVPTQYVYPLRLKGLTARVDSDGSVVLSNADGAAVVRLPQGYLEDASVDASGAGAMSHAIAYEVVTVDGGPALRVTIDGAWLKDPARKFPVVFDPTAVMATTTADTYVQSSPTPEINRAAEDAVAVGTWNAGGQKAKALLPFPTFGTTYAGKRMSAADLNVFMSFQGHDPACVARPFYVHRVTASWSSAVTYPTFPAVTSSIGNASPSNTAACNNDEKIRNVGTWVSVPLTVAAVNEWVTGASNYGLALTASLTDSQGWKRFTSANPNLVCSHGTYGSIQCDPFIDVTYTDNVVPQVDVQYPPNNSAINTLTPELVASGHDGDAWPAKGLRYEFVVYNDQGAQIHTSGWDADGIYKLPADVLVWGKTYLYAVKINDFSSTGPAVPVTFAFSTQVPQPMTTSTLAQNGGKGYEASTGNYTTSDTDAQVTSAGPALTINRDYNSLDTRVGNAFGRGWSSIVDMQAREGLDASGALQTVTVRYPNGQEVAFGRNNDGSWSPPQGRFSVFKPITGGYSLTDKDATNYEFTQAIGSGVYGLKKITDASGRAMELRYDANGRVDQLKSLTSNRSLAIAWTQPAGSAFWHVASVTTDPVNSADTGSVLTWTYSFTDDELRSVCEPQSAGACSTYAYTRVSQHASTVLNTGPYSFWRLNEPAGTIAASGVLSNDGTDNATYSPSIGFGATGPLPQSTSTAVTFNGTDSQVKLPAKSVTGVSYQSISMWFRNSAPLGTPGVLYSFQKDAVAPAATTAASYTPVLYIGTDGKVHGQFWTGNAAVALASAGTVADNAWHHVALVGNGGSQRLYLDGVDQNPSAPLTAPIIMNAADTTNSYLGAGFLGGTWPAQPNTTGTATFFTGSIADVAYFNKALTQTAISALYSAAVTPTAQLTTSTSAAGRLRAQVGYDTVTGRVKTVTDENGGIWKIGAPAATGSSRVYVSSVLGTQPSDYWRLADISAPADAVNQVLSHRGKYSNVSFDSTQPNTTSPFADSYGGVFNGTSSYLEPLNPEYGWGTDYPENNIPDLSTTVEVWFKTPVNHASSGVLYSYQATAIGNPAGAGDWVPALYVGADGFLRGEFWTGAGVPITSTKKVNDGNWHHAVLSASTTRQTLYLDNARVGTLGAMLYTGAEHSYIGAGKTTSWPSSSGAVSYFKGNIAEVAYYTRELSATEVDSHFKASKSALAPSGGASLTPVSSVTVLDPADKPVKQLFDLGNSGRMVAATDPLGNTTSYGYDVGGFESVVYDPLGMKTSSGRDIRGNTIRSTVCEDQLRCSTTYYEYWPDAVTANLTPDPRNDQLTAIHDARTWELADNKYRTSFAYDTAGNRISMTTPPLPLAGYPAGRTTLMTYTTASTAAVGGGFTPAGLPASTKSAGGRQQTTEYNSAGDVVRVTDAGGLVTEFTYDGLGRVKTKTLKGVPAGGGTADLITSFVYDPSGQVIEQVEPPVANQATGAIHQAATTTSYDADGNVTYRKVHDVTGGDVYRDSVSDFNDLGQEVKTVDAAGSVTMFEYDLYGNRTHTIACAINPAAGSPCPLDKRLRTMVNQFDAVGQQLTTTVIGSDGTSTLVSSRAYYANGNMAAETDAMNWTTNYTYTANDKVEKVTRTDGVQTYVVEDNSYDEVGNYISKRTNNGATWETFHYDEGNRLDTHTLQPGDLERVTTYQYDADDRVLSVRNSVGQFRTPLQTVTSTYDPMGRVTSQSVSANTVSAPVGWWQMSEPGPSWEAVDSSPSRLHLWADGGQLGRANGAAVFTGTSVYASTQPMITTTQSYSVSAWVNMANFNVAQTIVGEGGTNNGAFFLRYSKDVNKWAFYSPATDTASTTTPATAATSSTALAANTWVHLVGVFDSGTKATKLYVNGTLAGSGSNATPWDAGTPLTVGGIYHAGTEVQLLSGSVDNVQVYQRPLSATEASTLYGAGGGRGSDVSAQVDQLTTAYSVDKRGLTTAMTDPMGNLTNYEYDTAGQLAKTVYPSVSTETYGGGAPVPARPVTLTGYNTFGEPTETKDPLTNTVTTHYDAVGRPTKTILPDYTPPGGTPIQGAFTETAYNPLGQVASQTDRLGKVTSFDYDSLGNTVKVTDALGKQTTFVYDKVGDLLEQTDPMGARQTATYDYLGRKKTSTQVVRQPVLSANTTVYDYGTGAYGQENPAAGPWLQKMTSPDGVVTTTAYNWVGEPISVKDGALNETRTEYDGLGRAVKVTLPDSTKRTMTYDGASRVTRMQNLDAANTVLTTQTSVYDNNSNVIATTDPRGTTTNFTYDALNKLTSQTQPKTATTAINTTFGYDLAGQRTRFTDGRGNQFWTTYNAWSLPESQIEPATTAFPTAAERTFTATYDKAGRPKTTLMPGGVSTTSQYDDLSRVTEVTGTGAEAPTTTRTYGYDDAGRLKSLSTSGGSNTLTYDDRGLPLTVSGHSDNAAFSYSKDGQMASRADAAGTTSYTYDTAGRLQTAANPNTGINIAVGYNNLNQPSTITYGGSNQRTLTYDTLHRLKTDTLKTAGGAQTIGSVSYGYDANSNETSKTTVGFAGAAANTYTYDLANRLKSWNNGTTTVNYDYDDSGNRILNGPNTFTYDARNQLLAQNGSTTYTYTPRGTLATTTTGTVAHATSTDALGQVRSQQSATGTSTYEYDGLGRAIKPGFKYSGLGNKLAQDTTATYTRGPSGELLAEGAGTGANSVYAWTDLHTDVVGQFTATGTTLTGSASYDPLGKVVALAPMIGNLGYQSEWTDGITGRVNMMARWYNTDTGQFDTRDTASNSPAPRSVTANRFQYGDANPLTTVDPTGHSGWGIGSFFKAAVNVVTNPVATFKTVTSVASSAFNYVSSGRAWSDVKAGYNYVASKATKAFQVIKDSTTRWVKKKINTLKDAYHSAKKCLSAGVAKCVVDTAKKQAKALVDNVKKTVEAIKKDPWKFVATAAVGLAAAVAVGALCATGIGCLILAGAAAGAMSAGSGYMVDVARGDQKFSWSGLAGTMIEGGLDGALSAGISRFTGGIGNKIGLGGLGNKLGITGKPTGGASRPGGLKTYSPANPIRLKDDTGGSQPSPGRAPNPSCKHSFDPSTKVLMADGSTKQIGDIKVDDKVKATDPISGQTTDQPVTVLHENLDSDLTNVTVSTRPASTSDDDEAAEGKGARSSRGPTVTTTLETTQHHPFWDATAKAWVDAAKLEPGKSTLIGPDGEVQYVTAVWNFNGSKIMNDLTVDMVHTYYVIAGDTPVLVHNVNVPIGCGPNGEPIYEIPAGSSGGPGAKKRIPGSLLGDYDIGVNATPGNPTPLCSYCLTNPATSLDHVEPRAHGGDLTDANITPACQVLCNPWKNDTPLANWDAQILDEAGYGLNPDGSFYDLP